MALIYPSRSPSSSRKPIFWGCILGTIPESGRRLAAVSCPPILLFLALLFLNATRCGFPPSDFCFQLSVFQLFASWPVEQRALGLLLAGRDFDQAPNEMRSAIRAFVNSAKTLRVRYSFSTGFHCSSANRLHKSDPNLGFHCVNRIFAGLARRGDPFSQPSGSSAFLADALAGLIRTERSGPDVSCPAPSGSVFLVNRSITTRVGFGKRVRSPALRPSRHRRDQKTFSAGPRSFNSKELWFPGSISASGVQPVSDSRYGRITCKAYLSCDKE
jgi:hypothetical protein